MGLTDSQQHHLSSLLGELDAVATELAGDPEGLLALLRQLEHLHRQIQDGPFRSSLPADRDRLFAVLRSMETSGGWPYIPRLQLRTFMALLQGEDPPALDPAADQPLAA